MVRVTKVYYPDREKYNSYVDKIYESGWLTNNGPLVRMLEERLENYFGVKNVILVANGTMALELSYRVLALENEVITSPFSFIATTNSIVYSCLKPVFADIDPETFNIDPENIENLITDKTSAIVPVHIYGNACEVDRLEHIAKKHNLKLIFDAAHAFDVNYKDKSILGRGDISTISFHATKMFHTIEGGAIVTNNDEIAEKARLLRNSGITPDEKIIGAGTNAKMNEFEAAMGLCILDDIDMIINGRRKVLEYYKKELDGYVKFQKQNPDANQSVSYFPILLKSAEEREYVHNRLKENDINSKRYFSPSLDTLSYIDVPVPMKISRDIADRVLCLPFYHDLEFETIEKIASVIKQACSENIVQE
ncbi:DegT/DnrJ/EryC1/StrS family aminotransferase [Hydrogenimonas urashimensis]|uniref:DegT/DnrJ/EryC1/StrS family aminotransferase n=1 Tax=Hydrogenimonas urashimensis TaxID=2740515 RepID=UPI001916C1B7|nr:DegT/DnrJ/EryC1/StrS family aminotransferase [Hydrogenimonas urashimensis]